MKTPEQVIDSITRPHSFGTWSGLTLNTMKLVRDGMRLAIEADRAEHDALAYQVGHPDPTPDDWEDIEQCEAMDGVYMCTWSADHKGLPHIAGDGATIRAVWL